ncbi:MAG: hypothetical protein QGH34_03660 [Candidatus Woesearchaeota archaeon]|nr:hypothetical protein [Candidatus Woesearchaeota archaeon]
MKNKCKICKLVFECSYKNCCCPKCRSNKTFKFDVFGNIMKSENFVLV